MNTQFNEYQERWLNRLETTDDKQGTGSLFCERDDDVAGTTAGYCCLGLAAKDRGFEDDQLVHRGNLHSPEFKATLDDLELHDGDGSFIYEDYDAVYSSAIQINNSMIDSLAELNDTGVSFKSIASFIRMYPGLVFKNFDIPEQKNLSDLFSGEFTL